MKLEGIPSSMTEFTRLFGAGVRAARHERGWTQEALADAAECSTDTVGNIERGETAPSIEVFVRLVRVLHMDLRPLFVAAARDQTAPRSKHRVRLESDALYLIGTMSDDRLRLFIEMGRLLNKA